MAVDGFRRARKRDPRVPVLAAMQSAHERAGLGEHAPAGLGGHRRARARV